MAIPDDAPTTRLRYVLWLRTRSRPADARTTRDEYLTLMAHGPQEAAQEAGEVMRRRARGGQRITDGSLHTLVEPLDEPLDE